MDKLFMDNASQQKDSDNSKEEENEEDDINSYYNEDEISKKLEGIHLAIEPYKNQDIYDDFDEEKKTNSKIKKICTRASKKDKIRNEIMDLFN